MSFAARTRSSNRPGWATSLVIAVTLAICSSRDVQVFTRAMTVDPLAPTTWPVAERLTLMAGCLPRTPFRDQVAAAVHAGFDSLTGWPNVWRHAQRKDGLTLADMRDLLQDNGLVLTDVDACSDWATTPGVVRAGLPTAPRAEFLDVCAAL